MATLEHVLAQHEALCADARALVSKKGADYNRQEQQNGDTLANMRVAANLGLVGNPCMSVLVRLLDKFMRLKSLCADPTADPAVKAESVRDTIVDIINYAIYIYVFYCEARPSAGTDKPTLASLAYSGRLPLAECILGERVDDGCM